MKEQFVCSQLLSCKCNPTCGLKKKSFKRLSTKILVNHLNPDDITFAGFVCCHTYSSRTSRHQTIHSRKSPYSLHCIDCRMRKLIWKISKVTIEASSKD
jgi:hypothetical protein